MKNIYIENYYKKLYNMSFIDEKLLCENIIITSNLDAILTFLGLCKTEYFKISNDDSFKLFSYIKSSHFYNYELFKEYKLFSYYDKKYPKLNSYNYKKYINFTTKNIKTEHLKYFRQIDTIYYITLYDIELYKLENVYNFIPYYENRILLLKSFIKKVSTF